MKSRYLILPVFILMTSCLSAQEGDGGGESAKYNLRDHLAVGGNLGLSFGNVTYVGVAPIIGYKVSERFVPGIGLSYSYIRIRYPNYPEESAHFYGGSIWSRFYIIPQIFAHAEYESINGEWDPYFRPGYRYMLSSLFVGGGYCQRYGNFSSYMMVLYNINDSRESPYSSPLVIRVGAGFGF
jgi:hypothetical protein